MRPVLRIPTLKRGQRCRAARTFDAAQTLFATKMVRPTATIGRPKGIGNGQTTKPTKINTIAQIRRTRRRIPSPVTPVSDRPIII